MARPWAMFTAMALVLAFFTSAGVAAAAETAEGIVTSAAEGSLTVLGSDGAEMVFVVGEDTAITLDGEVASLEDLKEGFRVSVTYDAQDGEKVASEVAATTPNPED